MARESRSASGYKRTVCDSVARSTVASLATGQTLLPANDSRVHVTIFNDSTSVLYLAWGTAPATTNFTAKIPAQGMYELPAMPLVYVGPITGVWATADGSARITEVV